MIFLDSTGCLMLINSTLRLETINESPNYMNPWAVGNTTNSSATITVIRYQEKIYLLTNAHAVLNANYLKIKLNHNSTELPLESCWVDPILDLAILKTTTADAQSFLESQLQPLEITSEFQKQGTEVYAYGYPTGGRNLSFTKGNISRVEIKAMALSKYPSIVVQTSAAINPGNSGGPITCIIDNKEVCIGIVAQGAINLQNTGYFIPASSAIETIERFERYKKYKEKGFIDFITAPNFTFEWQSLKNKFLRKARGLLDSTLGEELTGILVSNVPNQSSAFGLLQEGDIVQKIDGISIQSNGEVVIADIEHPMPFQFIILRKQCFDYVILEVQRNNESNVLETREIRILLNKQLGQSAVSPTYTKPLKYHIQPAGEKGGFVFVRYTHDYGAAFHASKNSPPFFSHLQSIARNKSIPEIVVLQNIIPSEETDGFNEYPVINGQSCCSDYVVEANGKKIHCLFDLVSALSDTTQMSEVKFANGKILVIAPASAEATEHLRNKHKITFFTSPSLKRIKMEPTALLEEIQSHPRIL